MRPITIFAGLGAFSGAAATLLFLYLPEDWRLEPFSWLALFPGSLVPGLVFGVIVGLALTRRGLLAVWSYAAYVAASTLSYLAAVTLSIQVLADAFESMLAVGLVAGLFGSACLTALSTLMMPFVRQANPCLFMLFAGCLLGALLRIPFEFDVLLSWMFFFAAWQAGYAAALATALPPRRG
jgi:hypothetical protein